MKALLLTISVLITSTSLYAEEAVGIKEIKAIMNSVSFTKTTLGNTGTDADIVKLEQKIVDERSIKIDQLTMADQVFDKVEMSKNSVYFKIDF